MTDQEIVLKNAEAYNAGVASGEYVSNIDFKSETDVRRMSEEQLIHVAAISVFCHINGIAFPNLR